MKTLQTLLTFVPVIIKAIVAVILGAGTVVALIWGGFVAMDTMFSGKVVASENRMIELHNRDIQNLNTRLTTIEAQNNTIIKQQGDMLTGFIRMRRIK